jgi:hypothetical protein
MQWNNLRRFVPTDLASLVIVLGIVGSVITFFYHWASDIDVRARESRKPFLTVQLDTYTKILPVVAKITRLSSRRDDPSQKSAYTAAVDDFWDFYYGLLAMVEDEYVESAMVLFGKTLKADEQDGCARSRGAATLILDHCARNSIAASWGVKKVSQASDYCTPARLEDLHKICEHIPVQPAVAGDKGK